ncbi:MAG: putative membrane protein [Glaciecola sp.]|jgi:uncharacterized membrane protein
MVSFYTSVIALITGTVVLLNVKGTIFHKRVGYVYVSSMLILNLSSFFIISFGGFSLFHFFALVSFFTILAGMRAAWKRHKNWLTSHFCFMSWSVVGLYAALWSEIGTRFTTSMKDFWWIVALATFATVVIGAIIINKQAKKLKLR